MGEGGGSSRNVSVNGSNIPYIRVIHTCFVFCPNNVDSLPECLSTNCSNWGGGSYPPSRTPMLTRDHFSSQRPGLVSHMIIND